MESAARLILRATLAGVVIVFCGLWMRATAADVAASERDQLVIEFALRTRCLPPQFTVVSPNTGLGFLSVALDAWHDDVKQKLIGDLATAGIDVAALLGSLIDRNRSSATIPLASAPTKGYLIDVDNRYRNSMTRHINAGENSDSWANWRNEFPGAAGTTSVSLPADDKAGAVALVYVDFTSGRRSGSGWLYLLRIENGHVIEIKKTMAWVS